MKGFMIGAKEYPRGVYYGGSYSAGRNEDGTFDVYFDAQSHGATDDNWEIIGRYPGEFGPEAVRAAIQSRLERRV